MTAVSYFLSTGSFSATNARTPMFWRPTAFSIPEEVWQSLGGGAPSIGSRDRPFTTRPPRRFRSTRWANSTPYPNVPLAARMGFRRRTAPICTARSTPAAEVTSVREYHEAAAAFFKISEWGFELRKLGQD